MRLPYYLMVALLSMGTVTHAASNIHDPSAFVQRVKNDKLAGKKVYDAFCANCHAPKPLIAIQAPVFRDKQAWQHVMAQDNTLTMKHVLEGIGNMPPMGGCFECTEALLAEAVRYLLPQ